MLEIAVGVGLAVVIAAGIGYLAWRVARMKVTEVESGPQRRTEFLSDRDYKELLVDLNEDESQDCGPSRHSEGVERPRNLRRSAKQGDQ